MITIIRADEKPISLTGQVAGICYGKPTDGKDADSDYKRGLSCFKTNHGRTEEFPDIIIRTDGYSARCVREIYTHISGVSRLQESTRYIDMNAFSYFTPPSVEKNKKAKMAYEMLMSFVKATYKVLLEEGIPVEDTANVLPLAYNSSFILKINARALLHFADERFCSRAYIEIRQFGRELQAALRDYSPEWATIAEMMSPKCQRLGYCPEAKSCGLMPKRGD